MQITCILLRGGVIIDIESGRLVLLIGLPCIIAGVISVLTKKGIETGNLITIDLVCGGATSEEVGKQYIDYLEKRYRAKVVEFSVRYKNPNWTPPYLRAVFDNGQVFCKQFYETEYGYAFDKMKRESCYSCNFKGDNHLSDITIGDGWGVSQDAQGYNPFGVSVAFVHTASGNSIIHELSDVVLFEGDAETMKQNNPRYLIPKKKSMQYDQLKADFQRNGLLRACRKAHGIKRRLMNAIPEEILCSLRSLKHNMERSGK